MTNQSASWQSAYGKTHHQPAQGIVVAIMQTTWHYPRTIAHRGAGTLAPENTLAALRVAVARGWRMVEYDVKLSADGIPVLLHDTTLDRTTDDTGDAGRLPYASLALLDAGSWHSAAFAGEPVPSLRAVARYSLACGLASNIEIKPSPGTDQPTGTCIARAAQTLWRNATPPLLSSFSETALAAAQAVAPELPRALLLNAPLPADWRERAHRLGCIAVNLNERTVTRSTVRDVHDAGLRLVVWTVNDPAHAQQLLAWGADAVVSDALDSIKPA